jgi:hypothetical protein
MHLKALVLNRREFVRLSGLATGSLFLPACKSTRSAFNATDWLGQQGGRPAAIANLHAKSTAPSSGLPFKSFVFENELERASCHIKAGAEFRFYQDGSIHWEADVMSTDTDDEWRGSFSGGTAGYDGEVGSVTKFLFAVLPEYRFDIRDSNQWKHWIQQNDARALKFAPGIDLLHAFDSLQNLVFSCNC